MPKILTVDDSRAIRLLVSKHAKEIGLEVHEAEDGEQGLARLKEETFDMVVLDITMPVLDGPGMLARMREGGDKTPVLMLTSESKKSIIAQLMRLGINDYILKPFKPGELQSKMMKILKMDGAGAPAPSPAASTELERAPAPAHAHSPPPPSSLGAGVESGGKPFVDILVVDDMDNVQKRLRQMVPEHLSLGGVLSAQAALGICRERVFRVVLVDLDLPDVNSASLMKQMRLVQPHAAFLALALRTTNNVQEEVRQAGFDGILWKPFNAENVEDFLLRYFDNQEVIAKDDNLLRVTPFKGRESRLPGYFVQVGTLVARAIDDIAAACFGEVVLDLTGVPSVPEKVARLVIDMRERSAKVGLDLRLVGGPDLTRTLKQLADTADLRVYGTIGDAQAGKAA
jgi:two-component system, cell cycle response regulator